MKKNYLLSIVIVLSLFNFLNAQNSLKVMSFNKLYTTSNSSVLNVIRASGADVIGLQESYGASRSVANSLGFYHYSMSSSAAVISRYPITDTNSSGVEITLPDGLEVYVFNVHLTSYPYEPYQIRDRNIRIESQAITSANRTRGAEVTRLINNIQNFAPSNAPVFVLGDFNEPSHLDWTSRAANVRLHAIKVAWPASTRLTNIGMKDSWRAVYPNEITNPGDTWTPVRSSNEVYDRIDFVYHRGNNVSVTNAVRFGPRNDEAEFTLNGFTSDHRAVMATYNLPEGNSGGDDNGGVDYGSNLLKQSSAEESNLNNWIQVAGNSKRVRGGQGGYPSAKEGNYLFYFGNTSTGEMYQDVDVTNYLATIDAGTQSFLLNGFIRSYSGRDEGRIKVEFRNSNNVVLATFDSGWKSNQNTWEAIKDERLAPVGTRKVRVSLLSQRNSGRSNDGYIDALSLSTKTNTISNRSVNRMNTSDDASNRKLITKAWPNPAKDYIHINFRERFTGKLTIVNMLGAIEKTEEIRNSTDTEISILGISNGIYMLELVSEEGVKYRQKMIVK